MTSSFTAPARLHDAPALNTYVEQSPVRRIGSRSLTRIVARLNLAVSHPETRQRLRLN